MLPHHGRRAVRPFVRRRIADGLEARLVRSFVLRGSLGVGRRSRALGSVGAIRVSAPAGRLRTRSAWPMGFEDLVIVLPYADVTGHPGRRACSARA
jgi:hypothetical protein